MRSRQHGFRTEARGFELPPGRARIALIADTHGRPDPRLRSRLVELEPALILHAGDIGAREALAPLAEVAPLIAVRGNIDAVAADTPDEVLLELTREGELVVRLLLTHIAVYGPRLRADVRKRAIEASAQLIICGHSHVPFLAREGALTIFNPGSVGPRRFLLPIVFGVLTVEGGKLSLEHRDPETGAPWRPPGSAPALA